MIKSFDELKEQACAFIEKRAGKKGTGATKYRHLNERFGKCRFSIEDAVRALAFAGKITLDETNPRITLIYWGGRELETIKFERQWSRRITIPLASNRPHLRD